MCISTVNAENIVCNLYPKIHSYIFIVHTGFVNRIKQFIKSVLFGVIFYVHINRKLIEHMQY